MKALKPSFSLQFVLSSYKYIIISIKITVKTTNKNNFLDYQSNTFYCEKYLFIVFGISKPLLPLTKRNTMIPTKGKAIELLNTALPCPEQMKNIDLDNEGAIYFDEMAKAKIERVPHDGQLKTHAIWDLGFNDSMAIILAQKVASEIRVIGYIEGTQRTLADYSAELKALKLDGQSINWGQMWLPHDGFAARHQTGKTDAKVLQSLGWTVYRIPQSDVEGGIKRAREMSPRVYFNKERTERLIECLKRYRRHVSNATGEPGKPVHDEFSHGADAYRYLAMCSDDLSNETWDSTPLKIETRYVV